MRDDELYLMELTIAIFLSMVFVFSTIFMFRLLPIFEIPVSDWMVRFIIFPLRNFVIIPFVIVLPFCREFIGVIQLRIRTLALLLIPFLLIYYLDTIGGGFVMAAWIASNWTFVLGAVTLMFGGIRYWAVELSKTRDADYLGINKRIMRFSFSDIFIPSLVALIPLVATVVIPLAVTAMFALPLHDNLTGRFVTVVILCGLLITIGNCVIYLHVKDITKIGFFVKRLRGVILLNLGGSFLLAASYANLATSRFPCSIDFSSLHVSGAVIFYFVLCLYLCWYSLKSGYFSKGESKTLSVTTYNDRPHLVTHRHNEGCWMLFPCYVDEANKRIMIAKGCYEVKSLEGMNVRDLKGFSVSVD